MPVHKTIAHIKFWSEFRSKIKNASVYHSYRAELTVNLNLLLTNMNISNHTTFKRYCKTLSLKDDPQVIKEYQKIHQKIWPEIPKGMKKIGILDMEIYIYGNQLFMIMDTTSDFDHEVSMEKLIQQPQQAEWEAYVSKFQQAPPEASTNEKWQLMERIFKMSNPSKHHTAINGQLEKCPGV
jgi:L-rhamnose mutarotase